MEKGYNMTLSEKKGSHKKTNIVWFHMTKTLNQIIDQKSNGGCPQVSERKWRIFFNGFSISVWEVGKVLDIDSGNNCITMRINATLKWLKLWIYYGYSAII